MCDDGASPVPVWTLPTWFLRHVTILWLVRGDKCELPEYADSTQDSTRPSAIEAMLALLPMPLPT